MPDGVRPRPPSQARPRGARARRARRGGRVRLGVALDRAGRRRRRPRLGRPGRGEPAPAVLRDRLVRRGRHRRRTPRRRPGRALPRPLPAADPAGRRPRLRARRVPHAPGRRRARPGRPDQGRPRRRERTRLGRRRSRCRPVPWSRWRWCSSACPRSQRDRDARSGPADRRDHRAAVARTRSAGASPRSSPRRPPET